MSKGVTAVVVLLVLVLVPVSTLAATTYVNRWSDRPKLYGAYTVDYLYGGAGYGASVFSVGRFFYSTGGIYIGVVFKHDSSGNKLAENSLYLPSANVSFRDAEVNTVNNRVYVVGYTCNSVNCAGLAKNYTVSDLSTGNIYYWFNISADVDIAFYGACSDGAGNVYFVGELINRTMTPIQHNMVIYSFDQLWNPRWAKSYSGSYNLTGWDCVVAQDGYLYVTATDIWYYRGVNYPVYIYVVKINPASGDPLSSSGAVAYNSQGYANRYSLSYVGISATSSEVVVAFSYTDELPDPTNPSVGASIAGFDYTPSMTWRKNVTTSSDEVFENVAAGSNGEVVAGGYTYNNYGTSLSTTRRNAFLILLDASHVLEKAILAGDTRGLYNTIAYGVLVDGGGNVYWTGYAGDDDAYTAYYDVTSEVQVQGTPLAEPQAYNSDDSIKLPDYVVQGSREITARDLGRTGIGEARTPGKIPVSGFGVEATPGGESTGLIAATSETVSSPSPSPVPVPEPALGVIVATVALLTYLLYKSRRAH